LLQWLLQPCYKVVFSIWVSAPNLRARDAEDKYALDPQYSNSSHILLASAGYSQNSPLHCLSPVKEENTLILEIVQDDASLIFSTSVMLSDG
jgi:hypothetical protein